MSREVKIDLKTAVHQGWDAWSPQDDEFVPKGFRVEGDEGVIILDDDMWDDEEEEDMKFMVYLAIFPQDDSMAGESDMADYRFEFSYEGVDYVAFGSSD